MDTAEHAHKWWPNRERLQGPEKHTRLDQLRFRKLQADTGMGEWNVIA